MTPTARNACAIVGLALLVAAAAMVTVPLGVAAAGVALLVAAADWGQR